MENPRNYVKSIIFVHKRPFCGLRGPSWNCWIRFLGSIYGKTLQIHEFQKQVYHA